MEDDEDDAAEDNFVEHYICLRIARPEDYEVKPRMIATVAGRDYFCTPVKCFCTRTITTTGQEIKLFDEVRVFTPELSQLGRIRCMFGVQPMCAGELKESGMTPALLQDMLFSYPQVEVDVIGEWLNAANSEFSSPLTLIH